MSGDNGEDSDGEIELNPEDILEVIDLEENNAVGGEVSEEDEEENDGMEVETKDDAVLVFRKHNDSVFTVNIDPRTSSLAVTGSQDDRALVWNISSGEIVAECTGHKDSVTCVGFSHDSMYVATADMSGLIKVWKTETKEEIWSFECEEVEWLRWHSMTHVLLVGTTDGNVWMWKIPSGDCKTFHHNSSVLSGQILPDGKRLCTGCEDGSIKVWDLKSAEAIHTFTGYEAHSSSVLSLDCHQDNTLILTGSTDQTAKLINTQTGKVVSTFDCSHASEDGDDENSVEAVGLSSVFPYGATGCMNGILGIWDLPNQTLRHQCKHEAGIVKLKWDKAAPLVYTASLDGIIRLWDARNNTVVSQWEGHEAEILDFDISADGNTIVSVAEDSTARVFSIHTPDR